MSPLDHLARMLDEKEALIEHLSTRGEILRKDRDLQADTVRERTRELEELEQGVAKAAATLLELLKAPGYNEMEALAKQAICQLGQGHLLEEQPPDPIPLMIPRDARWEQAKEG